MDVNRTSRGNGLCPCSTISSWSSWRTWTNHLHCNYSNSCFDGRNTFAVSLIKLISKKNEGIVMDMATLYIVCKLWVLFWFTLCQHVLKPCLVNMNILRIDKWTYKEIWDHEWICSEEGWIRTYWKNEAVEEINNIFQLKI